MNKRSFATQYAVGFAGEEFLLGAHDWLKRALPGERRFDLVDTRPPFRRIEVKTDTHPLGDTPNLYAERRTVIYPKGGMSYRGATILVGGPWRALQDKVDCFVYLFPNGGTSAEPGEPVAFWFNDVPALVERLDDLIARGKCRAPRVRTGKVSAQGYTVPRELLMDRLPGVEEIRYQKKET